MNEQLGVVVEPLLGQQVWVETVQQSTCQSCAAKSACGHHVLQKTLKSKAHRVLADCSLDVHQGDVVQLRVDDGLVARAALWMYAFPLLLVAALLLLLSYFSVPEFVAIAAFFVAGLLAFLVLRYRFANQHDEFARPEVIAISDAGCAEQASVVHLQTSWNKEPNGDE